MVTYPFHIERGRTLAWTASGVWRTELWCGLSERLTLADVALPTFTLAGSTFSLSQAEAIGTALFSASTEDRESFFAQVADVITALTSHYVTIDGEPLVLGALTSIDLMEDAVRSMVFTRGRTRDFENWIRVPEPDKFGADVIIAAFALVTNDRTMNLLLNDGSLSSYGNLSIGGMDGHFPMVLLDYADGIDGDDLWLNTESPPLVPNGEYNDDLTITFAKQRTILAGSPRTAGGYSIAGAALYINDIRLPNFSPYPIDVTKWLIDGSNELRIVGAKWFTTGLWTPAIISTHTTPHETDVLTGRSLMADVCHTWFRRTAWVKFSVDHVEWNDFSCLHVPKPDTAYQNPLLESIGKWLGPPAIDESPCPPPDGYIWLGGFATITPPATEEQVLAGVDITHWFAPGFAGGGADCCERVYDIRAWYYGNGYPSTTAGHVSTDGTLTPNIVPTGSTGVNFVNGRYIFVDRCSYRDFMNLTIRCREAPVTPPINPEDWPELGTLHGDHYDAR